MMAQLKLQFPPQADEKKLAHFGGILRGILAELPERNRDVLARRFGLDSGIPETLEAIGSSYGITRERIRQIESVALEAVRKNQDRLEEAFTYLSNYMDTYGHVARQDTLFTGVGARVQNSIVLLLVLSEDFQYIEKDKHFHPVWVADSTQFTKAQKLVADINSYLKDLGELVSEEDLVVFALNHTRGISGGALASYLDAAQHVASNTYGRWGLVGWAEVKPRGMRDKAYIVMKQDGNPLHYANVADRINQTDFSSFGNDRKAHPQTVHNELIKDDRFVLIGRGLYALQEWGYESGTVKDVLRQVLSGAKNTPMTREQIINEVLGRREVKKNTIILNLQDKKVFKRLDNGAYVLA